MTDRPEPYAVPPELEPPLQKLLGIKMSFGPNGEGIAWVDIDREKHFGRTRVHGGLFPPLVDVAGAIAVAHSSEDALNAVDATIDMHVSYLRKAKEGDLTATARIVRRGRRVAVCEVDLTNNGELCGKAIVTYLLQANARPDPAGG
jgi:uncharacterized protein (TIGR00369 family)